MNNFYPRSPRGERLFAIWVSCANKNFYPRSPRGERHMVHVHIAIDAGFLSTLPARGATPPANGERDEI